jgi:O-antigen biosynthesis protein WbqV
LGAGVGGDAGPDGGRIFVLDMGEPVKILDLARRMIRLSGLRPDVDIKIEFVGLRAGEKLNEELFHAAEPLQTTSMSGVLLASPRVVDRAFLAKPLDEMAALSRNGDATAALALLRRLVPEFQGRPAAAPAVERARSGL